MLADARDTAEAAVPPQSAASGETGPLVVGKVAAPGAEPKKDAEQEASEEIARSDALLKAWQRGVGKTSKAKERFDLTIQPFISGDDAAIELKGVTAVNCGSTDQLTSANGSHTVTGCPKRVLVRCP